MGPRRKLLILGSSVISSFPKEMVVQGYDVHKESAVSDSPPESPAADRVH